MPNNKQKIYDCFLFASELELLELRMKILGPYVDYFLLVESPYTFPGEKKEMTFYKNRNRFDTSKIIHVVCDKLPYVGNVNGIRSRGKANERFSRDFMREGLKSADENDIILLSDIDEIPNPKKLISNIHVLDNESSLSNPKHPHFGMEMRLFYYYLNYMVKGVWYGTVVCKYKNFNHPSKMRRIRGSNSVKDGGWHYSYLGGVDRIRTKVNRLGSVQFNKDHFLEKDHLEKCLSSGTDLYNRRSIKIKKVNFEDYGPEGIKQFVEKYPKFIRN